MSVRQTMVLSMGGGSAKIDKQIKNPCVGGSILPRAAKNIPHQTPIHEDRRFALEGSQFSAPVPFPDHLLLVP